MDEENMDSYSDGSAVPESYYVCSCRIGFTRSERRTAGYR